jgi:LCP family protein required for cell wall assembly
VDEQEATERPKPTPYPRTREEEPAPPPAVPKKRSVVRTAAKVAVALLSVVALAATGYAYSTYHKVESDVNTMDVLTPPEDKKAPPADDGAEDILLVGIDARTDMQGNPLPLSVLKSLRTEQSGTINTDTLIILRVPHNGGKPSAISIPRDTYVDVPQGGQAKINSAFGTAKAAAATQLRRDGKRDSAEIERESDQAGRKALVQTIQDFTQIRVDHYAEVNLLGFYLLTEALGGVPVCLSHATEDKDSGADFTAGKHVVSGGEALSFVRQRKNLPRGDLDRIVRQQAFLGSALNKVLTAGVLTNPSTLGGLSDALNKSLVLDAGFDLLQFAEKAKGLASGDVAFETIPVITINGRSPDGQSIVEVDLPAVRQFVAGLAGRTGTGNGSGGGATGGVAPAAFTTPLTQASVDGVPCVN